MRENDTVEAVLSIGSNTGDREENISKAIRLISELPETELSDVSPMYETEPVGYTDQPFFLNVCIRIMTSLEPLELLDALHGIENALKRKRTVRWGPRTIDIDIITYGDLTVQTDRLTIPHPRYKERAFVLIPMRDIGAYEGDIPEDKSVVKIPWEFEV